MNNDEVKFDIEYFNFLPQWIYFGVKYSAPALNGLGYHFLASNSCQSFNFNYLIKYLKFETGE